jgi:DNA-binding CsgD family transcriptional regulator
MNGDRVLEGKTIYIAGSRHLDSKALACFIAKETGALCEEVSFEHMETLARESHPPKSLLFLMDAFDPGLRQATPEKNGGTNGMLPAGLFPILFREDPNGNGPDKTAPGCICGFFYRFDSADRFLQALLDLFTDRELIPQRPPVGFIRPGFAHDQAGTHPLSPREFHILFLMAGGLNNKDIAARLNISSHTVRTHLYNIFRKINVRSRVQASLWVHKNVEKFFCVI